ncbi:hypothetical protein V8G54_037901 (chloroplast) [Vigna mungo]|uniref:HTH La-type RNA-binding domain-containing protein n=1 Tax=Vigna mungo TaxID=3915 RepID=A0AAQ3MDD3_VIGMU
MTSQAPQKQSNTNVKANPATNYNVPGRQRSMKRVGGSGIVSGPSQSNFSNPPPPPPPPPFPVYHLPPPVSYGMVTVVPEPAPRDHYRNGNWDPRSMMGGFVPGMNEYRGSSHRNYFGHNPRGDGSYHNSYGSRHDQDRRNYGNTRDTFVPQPRMPPRGLLRHPPPSPAAFVGHQPIGPFANPMGFSEFYYYQPVTMDQFTGMPYFTPGPPPATFISATESALSNMILRQIEYYFSDANLVRDEFLRSKMDEQGWVPVTLIADFPRVKSLTTNVQLILDSMRTSTIVEVLGDKLRRHNDWMKWLSSKTRSESTSTSSSPRGSRSNNLTANFQAITLEETAESCSLPQLSNGGATGSST